jgi:NAD(P)H-hydrate epimerase
MKAVTCQQMRELDRRTIEDYAVPGEALMNLAGAGVARAVRRLAEWMSRPRIAVKVIAGRGNNGGDAFVAARLLAEWGFPCEVWLAGRSAALHPDVQMHLARMKAADIPLHEWGAEEDWTDFSPRATEGPMILVDGLLGTGATGPAHGAVGEAIRCINHFAARHPVVAIDIPSGLDGDTGEALGETVQADVTVTMGLPKVGLLASSAVNYVGNLDVVDIGIPQELIDGAESNLDLIAEADVIRLLRRRARDAHKGTYGSVAIIAGSDGYAGAAVLAARAAVRSGVGLVTLLTPALVAPGIVTAVPEAMVHFGAQTDSGSLAPDCLRKWTRNINDFDAVLIGPGLAAKDSSRDLVLELLKACHVPVVLDADALNVCAGRLHVIKQAAGPVVITPHPGEMARLLGQGGSADVQANRMGAARQAAELSGAVVVLKGAGTLVVGHDRAPAVNMTGNPGMAVGGMGDALGGILAGLIAQGLAPWDAARVAVYAHGRAGDRAAWRVSQTGLAAGDLIAEVPLVWKDLVGR